MRVQRLAIGLTVLNLMLLVGLVAERVRPAAAEESKPEAQDVVPMLRARALEIVDERNRVRAQLAVMPPSTVDGKTYQESVLLRLIDPKSGPVVKISAMPDGAGMFLSDETDRGVLIQARGEGNFVKVTNKDGRDTVLKP
jgi:hypothetical protein